MEFTAAGQSGILTHHSQLIAVKQTSTCTVIQTMRVQRYNFFRNKCINSEKSCTFAPDLVIPGCFIGEERESGERPEQCPLL